MPFAGPAPAASAASAASAAPTTYYVDTVNGSDTNRGTSSGAPLRSLGKVNSLAFSPGDVVLLRRGQTWSGRLKVPTTMTVGAWGAGDAPVITGGDGGACVDVTGAGATVTDIKVAGCTATGIALRGSGQQVTGVVAENNGGPAVRVDPGATNATVTRSTFSRNRAGIAIGGSGVEVFANTFRNNNNALVVSNAQGIRVHHNVSTDDTAFARLVTTNAGDATNDVSISYNRYWSSAPAGRLVTAHGENGRPGAVSGVRIRNNTALLTGADSVGVLCVFACTTSVLTEVRGNVISATGVPMTTDGATGVDNILWGGSSSSTTRPRTLGPGERWTNPNFANPATGDLRLVRSSPAIDLVSAPSYAKQTLDLDGNAGWTGAAALIDGNGDGTPRLDAGAYEAPAAQRELKPALQGLVVTQPQQHLASVPYARFATIKVDWRDLEPVDDRFDFRQITNVLGAYDGQAGRRLVHFRVRIMAGIDAPSWVKGAAVNGPNPETTKPSNVCTTGISVYPDSPNGNQGCVPRFWTSAFQAEYLEMMAAFASAFEAHPQVVDVVNSACTTIFAEPLIIGAEDKEALSGPAVRVTSTDRLGAQGYTKAAHDACIKDTTARLVELMPTTRISMSGHGAWQYISNDATDFKMKYGDWASARTLWDYLRAQHGPQLVIEDHGLKATSTACLNPTADQAAGSWYCYLAAMPGTAPHGWQFTAGDRAWMPIAAQKGVAMRACYLEFASFNGLDVLTRRLVHEALLANCAVAAPLR